MLCLIPLTATYAHTTHDPFQGSRAQTHRKSLEPLDLSRGGLLQKAQTMPQSFPRTNTAPAAYKTEAMPPILRGIFERD